MGNTCTSAKTDPTIQKSVQPSNATIYQLPPVENSTAMKTVTEEDPSPPKDASEAAPSAPPVALQPPETSSTEHEERNE
ncbi:unnamed protein product [Rotaria socialis]|nr:unnamed protein product [Rotaria socialis]CAF3436768.1 unnamed protein product [Rotaria socialis]CAF3455179.1 unnamed protein product [Rotaria socialis]CAF4133510.1 unnamed protein product [Rotaria socialis]CAF4207374.1 unnamed protein product [Rotaria socialis]